MRNTSPVWEICQTYVTWKVRIQLWSIGQRRGWNIKGAHLLVLIFNFGHGQKLHRFAFKQDLGAWGQRYGGLGSREEVAAYHGWWLSSGRGVGGDESEEGRGGG